MTTQFSKPMVVIIDDDEIDVTILTKTLQNVGKPFELAVFRNGKEALEYFSGNVIKGFPLLMFLDINMPFMNGFEFLEEFEKMGSINGNTRVVILSSSENSKDLESSRQYRSVIGYQVKPITESYLVELLS